MAIPENLPIYEVKEAICTALSQSNRLVLQAPTGSGKSTQVPQMLLDSQIGCDGQIVVLQPRRIAARMLAARVSSERNTRLSEETGYQIRFENKTSSKTRIRFVTEAILLRQIVSDPELKGISTIIFDEFHERHLHGDITLARALQIQKDSRPDLKIIVMSATLAKSELVDFLAPCESVASEGRMYPVSVEYWKRSVGPKATPVWDAAAEAFESWSAQNPTGDVLIFMPGNFEIQKTIQSLQVSHATSGYTILPLHGELPPDQQDAAVGKLDKPKIIVSTNVAETSLTIDGIKLVIDSGLARIANYDAARGINTLHIHQISQSSADQRKGRAGRTSHGHCIRLWKEEDHAHRPPHDIPEIHRLDLAETLLNLKCSGIDNVREFQWFDPPNSSSLENAFTVLHDLSAIDNSDALTEMGRKMQAFPTHPRYSRLLLAASEFGCVNQACLIAALTQSRSILISRVDRSTSERREDILGSEHTSDFFMEMRAWRFAMSKRFQTKECRLLGIHAASARQIQPLFNQFLKIAEKEGLDTSPGKASDENIRRCLLLAFSDRLARRLDRGTVRCQMVHNRRGDIARESVIDDAEYFVASEIHEIEGRDKSVQTLLSKNTAIDEDWLLQHFPQDFNTSPHVELDPSTKRVVALNKFSFRDLILKFERADDPDPDLAARLLAMAAHDEKIPLKNWDTKVDNFIARVNALARYCPELEIPPIGPDEEVDILVDVCHGAFSAKDIKDRDVMPHVKAWLNPTQLDLVNKFAPEKLELKNGKKIRVEYPTNQQPFIAARIQDLLQTSKLPQILMGNESPLIHILAPNFRPVQITQDLTNFWSSQYPDRKKELQRRYPKHQWPDNPLE